MNHFLGGIKTNNLNKKGNIMTPLNWLAGTVTAALFAIPRLNNNIIISSIVVLVFLVFIFYATMYVFWSIKDPNRLQSEQYNLETKEIALRIESTDKIEAVDGKSKIITVDQLSG